MVNVDFHETVLGEHFFKIEASRSASVRLIENISGIRSKGPYWLSPVRYDILVQLITLYESNELTLSKDVHRWLELQRDARSERTTAPTTSVPHLHEYQSRAVEWLLYSTHGLLSAGVGTGKTRVALEAISRAGNPSLPSVVVTTASAISGWVEEAAKLPLELDLRPVVGTLPQRRKVFDSYTPRTVFVMSYDAVVSHGRVSGYGSTKLSKKDRELKELDFIDFSCVVVDEAHRLANPTNKSTRAVWSLAKRADTRFGLTATAMRNISGDLWGIFRFLDPALYTSRERFIEFYCDYYVDWYKNVVVKGIRNDREVAFSSAVGHDILVIASDEVNDLPPVVTKLHKVRWSPLGKRQYKQLTAEGQFEAPILGSKDKALIPVEPGGPSQVRGMQMAQGGIEYDTETDPAIFRIATKTNPKLDALDDIVAGFTENDQAVIFGVSVDLVAGAIKRLGSDKCAVITGQTLQKDREEAVREFRDGERQFFVGSIQAAGEGINLSCAANMVLLQSDFSASNSIQALGRIRRQGQQADVICYHIITTEDSPDERPAKLIAAKLEQMEQVYDNSSTLEGV